MQPQSQPCVVGGRHLGQGHRHGARQIQHQPRPAGPEHPRPQIARYMVRSLRHRPASPGPIDLAKIQHHARRIGQKPHPPRHRLRQGKADFHTAAAVVDAPSCPDPAAPAPTSSCATARLGKPQCQQSTSKKPFHLGINTQIPTAVQITAPPYRRASAPAPRQYPPWPAHRKTARSAAAHRVKVQPRRHRHPRLVQNVARKLQAVLRQVATHRHRYKTPHPAARSW